MCFQAEAQQAFSLFHAYNKITNASWLQTSFDWGKNAVNSVTGVPAGREAADAENGFSNMTFKVNDWVVHPKHGVGRIVKIEIRQFSALEEQRYYEISILNGTVWVQVDESSSGLRKLTTKDELSRYRDILKSRPKKLSADYRKRHSELTDRMRQGSLKARCEVVRDLSALGWNKPLGEQNSTLLRVAHQALYQEWAIADGVSLRDATQEVLALLQEGKSLYEE